MAKRYDAVVIGGGHNGLITAAYLAKAGKSVVVLEKNPILGGAATTVEHVPGFRFSAMSYVVSLLFARGSSASCSCPSTASRSSRSTARSRRSMTTTSGA